MARKGIGAFLAVLLFQSLSPEVRAQIGTGWKEYLPKWDYHVPPNAAAEGQRYTYKDGIFHLWVKDTDQSTFPGRDSGPRSEVRVLNEYTSGDHQFEADVMVVAGAEHVGTWQLFQDPTPWMIRVYDGQYRQFGNGSTVASVPFGKYQRFNAVHSPAAKKLEIYLDGKLAMSATLGSEAGTEFYNKFGVYGREGMGTLNEIYYKNVKYFNKTGSGTARIIPLPARAVVGPMEAFTPLGRKADRWERPWLIRLAPR